MLQFLTGRRGRKFSPAAAGAVYLAVGVLWVAFSDAVGNALFSSTVQLTNFQSYKGLLFVAFTALFIYVVLQRAGRIDEPGAELPAHRRPAWPLSLGATLVLLMLALEVPLVGVAAWSLHRESDNRTEQARNTVAGMALASSAAIAEVVAGNARMADLIASHGHTRTVDRRHCDPLLRDAARPDGAVLAVLVVDGQGRLVCAARGPVPAGAISILPPGGSPEEGDLLIGAPELLPGTGEWAVSMRRTIRQADGSVTGAVQLVLALKALRPGIASALPRGGVASILSEDGYVIARSLEEEKYVGRQSNTELGRRIARQRNGLEQAVGVDGVERLYAFRAVAGTPWSAVVAVPVADLEGPAVRRALQFTIGAALLILLTTCVAYWLARCISRPIHALKRTAERVGQGHLDQRAPEYGPYEIRNVAAGFNRMMDTAEEVVGKLRESAVRNQSLVEMAPDGIAVHEEGRITATNPRFQVMFGQRRPGTMGDAALVALAEGEGAPALAVRLHRLAQQPGQAEPLALRMRRFDGSVIEVEHTGSSTLQDGRMVVQSHFLDVTARNHALAGLAQANQSLERRIEERTRELARANSALESFSYSVAHDLRSPVDRISGFALALAEAVERGDADRARRYAQRVDHNTRQMSEMIDALLQLARVDRAPLARERCAMGEIVAQEVELLAQRRVEWDIGPLPAVDGDATLLRRVWHNLLGNAAKYSGKREHPRVEVRARREDGWLVFTVADNGVGFEPGEETRLFQPFSRLQEAEAFPGTGVGLVLVKRILERHGGWIRAEARAEGGACFSFALPDARG